MYHWNNVACLELPFLPCNKGSEHLCSLSYCCFYGMKPQGLHCESTRTQRIPFATWRNHPLLSAPNKRKRCLELSENISASQGLHRGCTGSTCDTRASGIGSGWPFRCDGRGRGRWDAQDRPVWSKKLCIRKLQSLKALESHRLGRGRYSSCISNIELSEKVLQFLRAGVFAMSSLVPAMCAWQSIPPKQFSIPLVEWLGGGCL